MSAQLTFDALGRGTRNRPCRYRRPSWQTGTVVDGAVILGTCSMGRGTVYDRDCDICTIPEGDE